MPEGLYDMEFTNVATVGVETAKPEVIEKPERKTKPAAKSAAPTLDEWQDFIGRFVIRGITEGYLQLALADYY